MCLYRQKQKKEDSFEEVLHTDKQPKTPGGVEGLRRREGERGGWERG